MGGKRKSGEGAKAAAKKRVKEEPLAIEHDKPAHQAFRSWLPLGCTRALLNFKAFA